MAGAVGDIAAGAAIGGSALGPLGALGGGIIGGFANLFGGESDEEKAAKDKKRASYWKDGLPSLDQPGLSDEEYARRQAMARQQAALTGFQGGRPSGYWEGQAKRAAGATADFGLSMDSRARALEAMGMLQGQASGDVSLARQLGLSQQDAAQQQIASQLAGARGGYDPSSLRAAMMAGGQSSQAIAGRTQTAALQEQLGAQRAYLGASGAMRGRDIQQAQIQALVQQQAEQLAFRYRSQGYSARVAQMKAALDVERLRAGVSGEAAKLDAQGKITEKDVLKIGSGVVMKGAEIGAKFL